MKEENSDGKYKGVGGEGKERKEEVNGIVVGTTMSPYLFSLVMNELTNSSFGSVTVYVSKHSLNKYK